MSANSKIEWCDHSWNGWIGCTKVSPGCANCYAEGESKRRGWAQWGKGKPRHRTSESYWKQPLRWDKTAICDHCGYTTSAEGVGFECGHCFGQGKFRRPRVFCASLADWLDDEVPIEWLADLLALIPATPNLDWLLLTKRPENWKLRIGAAMDYTIDFNEAGPGRMQVEDWLRDWLNREIAPRNIWLGVSVEDQERANERLWQLIDIPAKVRFLSAEPLLGPINLGEAAFLGARSWRKNIHWVIVGGESGPHARPCNVEWSRNLISQCKAAGVPVFVKQLGAHIITNGITGPGQHWPRTTDLLDTGKGYFRKYLVNRKGGDWNEWPQDLRVREFPILL